jgi:hypothetical protein
MVRYQAIATPVWRLWNLAFRILGLQLGQAPFEDFPIRDDVALVGG